MRIKILLATVAVAAVAAGAASATEFVTNGGFETGDFTGWTVNAGATGVELAGYDGENPNSGDYFAALGDTSDSYPYGTLSQTLGTTAGQALTLSFFLMSDGATPNFFSVDWNGVEIAGSALTNLPDTRPNGYVQYTYNLVAAGSDVLTFHEQNQPAYMALDDVSVTEGVAGVPEPASWALMLTGVFGAGAALRSTRRRSAVATA